MSIEIRLESLRKGPQKVEEPIERDTLIERLATTYRLNDVPFVVHATSTLYTNVVEVKGHVEGSLSFECSRCGETKQVGINTPFHHSFVPHGELDISDADDIENSLEDNIDVSEHDGHSVQLEPIALEHFLVELPYAPTCETGGLSPCKGVNLDKVNATQGSLPEHPFHAALKKLKLPKSDTEN